MELLLQIYILYLAILLFQDLLVLYRVGNSLPFLDATTIATSVGSPELFQRVGLSLSFSSVALLQSEAIIIAFSIPAVSLVTLSPFLSRPPSGERPSND